MMREIVFKAKRTDNGEWVEGNFVVGPNNTAYIFPVCGVLWDVNEIDPSTVCQYTGLTDDNGVKIWEGDTMEFDAYGFHYSGDVRIFEGNACVWCEKCAPFLDDAVKTKGAIVTGNIYDKEKTT